VNKSCSLETAAFYVVGYIVTMMLLMLYSASRR